MKDREHFLEPEVRDGVPVSVELKAIWKVLMDILEVFIRVCEKHELNYAMDGGSLLGAIRHHGFIPWDDDIDVQMPRKDYDRLLKLLPSELPEGLYLQTFETEPESWLAHARLMNVNTAAIEPRYITGRCRVAMGLHIDIAPIDGMPSSERSRKRMVRVSKFWLGVARNGFSRNITTFAERVRHWVGRFLFMIIGRHRLFNLRDGVFRKVDFEETGIGATMPANHFFLSHSWRKREWFDKYISVPFEYLTVKVPCGYEGQLVQQYGENWRIPSHHCAFSHFEMQTNAAKSYKEVLVEHYGYDPRWLDNLP